MVRSWERANDCHHPTTCAGLVCGIPGKHLELDMMTGHVIMTCPNRVPNPSVQVRRPDEGGASEVRKGVKHGEMRSQEIVNMQ